MQSLGQPHQLRVALGHAGALSCHLRFGREATYAGDLAALRADNATDYPWLRFAVLTLLEALDRDASAPECTHYLEALVGALSADPEWLMADHEVAARVAAHRDALRRATETFRPGDAGYSPLALFYNFSHNIVKGAVVDAMLWGDPWNVTLNDLFTSDGALSHHASPLGRRQKLAVTLMDYARKNPHRIDGRPVPVIVYDPASGRRLLDGLRRAI